ncbi:MAG: FG-GAP-like repeat-containing protein, partial [Bacteroidota bacterium]
LLHWPQKDPGGQNNFLYNNNGDGTFTKILSSVVTTDGGNSHGSVWADTDNDGDQDLLVTNDQDEDNFLYTNDGDGTFTKVENEITQDGGNSFATAVADYDNDGDIDIAIVNHSGGINFFYSNERGRCNGKACITLAGDGSNESAIGARVKVLANVYGNTFWQMREISSQSGGGLSAQSEMKALIGVGDATIIDSLVIEWPSGFVQSYGSTTVDSCMIITEDAGSLVCGSIFHDKNADGTQDGDEVDLEGVQLTITPGNRVIYTDENGDYEIKLNPGTYTVTVNPNASWTQVSPTSPTDYTINVIGTGGTYCGNDFGLQPSCTTPDMKLDIINTTHRVGFYNLHNITYENLGGDGAKDVTIEVDFGPDMPLVESTIPWDSKVGTVYTWNIGQVDIGKRVSFIVKDSIPGDTPIESTFEIDGSLSTSSTDCDLTNNDVLKTITFTGAFDPNDILVDPEGFIKGDQELTYKIRFQNVGNQAVTDVVLIDELPASLDVSSLVLGAASHAYKFRIEDERTLVWDFENINLIDSVANEPESHGYAIFRIKPKADLEPGTVIPNTAAIYFDNNTPVITNTVENIIRTTEGVQEGELFIFPNPMSNSAYFELIPLNTNLSEEIRSVTIYNIMGSKVYESFGIRGQQFRFENEDLDPGYYFIEVISDEQNRYTGKMIIQR